MHKILVVDDEESLCALMKSSLEATGKYDVMATSEPQDVLDICLREQPDLILLDIVMPHMSGTQIIKMLKDEPRTSRIIIIVTSGLGEMVYDGKKEEWKWEPNRQLVYERGEVYKEASSEETAKAYGVDDFLSKPFSPRSLLLTVEEHLKKRMKGEDG